MTMFKLERKGSAPPVVFVHGFCQSSAYWAPTLELVAERGARGIAVDLPGFGASAAEPGPYTMEGLANALAHALDTWDAGPKITLVGGSMGGVVAQHFALRHPERVGRLLLVATGGFTPNMDGFHSTRSASLPGSIEPLMRSSKVRNALLMVATCSASLRVIF